MNTSTKPKTVFTFVVSLCFALSFVLSYVSCKKKATTAPTPPADVLCNGRSIVTFLPLSNGNKWEVDASSPYLDHTVEINGAKNISGNIYFEAHYVSPAEDYYLDYRMDANGDIYKYNASDLKEYLDIPANPTTGEIIATYHSGDYIQVASTNATYNTGKCVYTGILQIEWHSQGTVISTHYYKRGLGQVGETSNLGPENLVGVTLN